MMVLESFGIALRSLRANKMRSFLTMLGVIIGVGSMVLMVAVVEGFQSNIRKQFEGLGSRLVFIFYNPDENARRSTKSVIVPVPTGRACGTTARCAWPVASFAEPSAAHNAGSPFRGWSPPRRAVRSQVPA